MKRLSVFIFLLACVTQVFSQKTNCTQVLRLVRSTYEQGRLHELENMMKGCLTGTGQDSFTKAEKREAYRYLTLAHIYLEEPEAADSAMLKLLETDHFFEINTSLDPAEFIALYKKFRHDPLYSIGIKFLVNMSQPTVSSYYNIGSAGAAQGKYQFNIGIQALAFFEKDILRKYSKRLVAAPEIGYVVRSYSYHNDRLAVADEDPNKSISTQDFAISQGWLDVNAIIQYKLKNTTDFKTYIGLGPGISYLLSSANQASTLLGNGFTITGGSVDDKKSYNSLVYSVSLLAGAKIKFADFYIVGDIRYQYGLTNAINPASRTNSSVGFDYQGQYNDYKMNNLMINVGISYPVFKPKKLIK